ncbi:PTS lactose/cellobiose transporter subunit IIA, partial [Enterocloster asparagiformis]
MDETKYSGAFQIIMNAGNSKSAALMAIEAAKDGDFAEADERLREAETEMRAAHQAQIDMIQQEAAGNSVDVNIIL